MEPFHADPLRAALHEHELLLTRRRLFAAGARTFAAGVGMAALGSLLPRDAMAASPSAQQRHWRPKAKRVIYLHMEGGPSHLDLWDYKPDLRKRYNQDLPESIRKGQRLTTMTSGQGRFPVAPSLFTFSRYANQQDGVWISELMPHTGSVANELCFLHSMHTDAINHEPAITFCQTGHQQPGRPSLGAWASYGLGSANANLPTFCVLITQGIGNMQALSARFWGSGFLPSEHQGCRLRSSGDPVLYLKDPAGVARTDRRAMLDLVNDFNEREAQASLDGETRARIAQAEMAYRMQMSVPELADLSDEDDETFALYGEEARKPGTFAANCLLARRLSERGVRFVQLYMRGWDQHGNLPAEMRAQSKAVDQPQAALIKDLRRRGLLDETLVVWGGEFGRTVYSQGSLSETDYGRDHHPRCFTMWCAGGGLKSGLSLGRTDDYGYNIVERPIEVHDLHATMLSLMGFDHEKLVYPFQGRDYRLTDVSGRVIEEIVA